MNDFTIENTLFLAFNRLAQVVLDAGAYYVHKKELEDHR